MQAEMTDMTKQNTDVQSAEQQSMVDAVLLKNDQLEQAIDDFYNLPRRTDNDYMTLTQTIVNTIDDILSLGDWDSSAFLRTTIRPLRDRRDRALKVLDVMKAQQNEKPARELTEADCKVYISLYQTDGHNLDLWEQQLQSLPAYIQGRPIYRDELEVEKMIRSKPNPAVEAYAVIVVKKADLVTSMGFRRHIDKTGTALVNLHPGAVLVENVLELVHQQKRYEWNNKKKRLQIKQ